MNDAEEIRNAITLALLVAGELMNRCVEVEQILLDIANGKRVRPTREECRALALRLGGVRGKDKS